STSSSRQFTSLSCFFVINLKNPSPGSLVRLRSNIDTFFSKSFMDIQDLYEERGNSKKKYYT
ncbi:hypothetical protein L9F63_013749, partial [Diploptera punctata]